MANFGMQIIESLQAVEQDGYEDKEIKVKRGGFWERIFDPDPTYHIWDDYKIKVIQVPHYKPVIFKLLDKLIVHPSLMPEIKKAINKTKFFEW